jgi:signal transduction histidine kinase
MTREELIRRHLAHEQARKMSVNRLLRELEQLARAHPALHKNEFSTTLLSEDIGVKINGADLIQILINLSVNAFECSPQPHRVDVGGEVLRAPIDLTAFKEGPNNRILNLKTLDNTVPLLKLWVQDTGPGIPPEVLPQIFHPFFTTKGPSPGAGLGLTVVQRLVEEASGALHVHTKQGNGTVFTIYLPGAAPAPAR